MTEPKSMEPGVLEEAGRYRGSVEGTVDLRNATRRWPVTVVDLRHGDPPAARKYGVASQRALYVERRESARRAQTTRYAVTLESQLPMPDGTVRHSLAPIAEHELHPRDFRRALELGLITERHDLAPSSAEPTDVA